MDFDTRQALRFGLQGPHCGRQEILKKGCLVRMLDRKVQAALSEHWLGRSRLLGQNTG